MSFHLKISDALFIFSADPRPFVRVCVRSWELQIRHTFLSLSRKPVRHNAGSGSFALVTVTDPAFLAFLNGQRADFGNSLPERLAKIESLWSQVLSGEKPAQALALLQRCAHTLAGSGATFGFAGVGNAARELEYAVNPFIDLAFTLTTSAQTEISGAIALLRCSLPGEAGIPGNSP